VPHAATGEPTNLLGHEDPLLALAELGISLSAALRCTNSIQSGQKPAILEVGI
jgi:hypothetical protein